MARVRIQGMPEALAKLDAIADLGQFAEVQSVMMEAAKMVTDQVRENIDERDSAIHQFTSGKTGTLGGSAGPRRGWRPHTIMVRGREIKVESGDLKRSVVEKPYGKSSAVAKIEFLKAPHAWFLEYGFKLRDGSMYPPEGFFRRAVEVMKRPVASYIKARMSDILDRFTGDGTFGRKKAA